MTHLLITPRATEKAYGLSTQGTYVFDVPLAANKPEIKKAIESQYDVTIVSITTAVQSGKPKRYNRGKNRYPGTTNRSDSKKAYVTLKEGDSIQVFQEQAQEETK